MSSALAIAYREPTRRWLAPLFLVSIGLHFGAAMLALWASHRFQDTRGGDDMGSAGPSGERVVQLIEPDSSDQLPAEEPPDIPPPPDPPDPIPPVQPDSDVIEPAKPEPKVIPVPRKADRAKKGLTHRAGVIDGNDTQGKTEGTPGLKTSSSSGAYRPEPPYPDAARIARIQGKGEMRVTYGPTGSVTIVIITRPINPLLDANTRSFVRAHWKGTPNTMQTHPVKYVLPR